MTLLRKPGWVLGVAGVALLATVPVCFRPDPDKGVTVDTVRFLGAPTTETKVPVVITITNRTAHAVRVIGSDEEGCGTNVCFEARNVAPTDLAPGESTNLSYTLKFHQPGPFSGRAKLFIQRNGYLERVPVTFEGVTQPTGEPAH